jgi:hypothetical protein
MNAMISYRLAGWLACWIGRLAGWLASWIGRFVEAT